ncbi:hypothetical protein AB0N09_07970 [Streptomyces erythrochromogenes]|uniref:hypothetical protein n=1 Tax=Streptomyces erythrochromogenes TaxID=285574 RepID=UPI00343F9784
MTQRLDAGAGWYGEFLRRDPEGVRACLNGAAIPPWDVMESLLRDLAGAAGAELAARETVYAARLRAAAVTVWDRLPGGEEELRTLLVAAAAQRAESEAALRSLTARLGGTADRAEIDALTRELSWTQDDVARAAARHEDLAARLTALESTPSQTVPHQRSPLPPRSLTRTGSARAGARPQAPAEPGTDPEDPDVQSAADTGARRTASPGAAAPAQAAAADGAWAQSPAPGSPDPAARARGGAPTQGAAPAEARPTVSPGEGAPVRTGTAWSSVRPQAPAEPGTDPAAADTWPAEPSGPWRAASPGPAEPVPTDARAGDRPQAPEPLDAGPGAPARPAAPPPVGRAEGRWLRGARRAGGARYAGAAVPETPAFTPPPGHPDAGSPGGQPSPPSRPAPRGARFGRPRPEPDPQPDPQPERTPVPQTVPSPAPPTGSPRAVAAELLSLRAQGRTGEAHALLCQAAAWPAGQLPGLAAELGRAGLAADWATLLWEAASLPPEQLAAAAAALGDAGREGDRDALLRQGVARPCAEVADAALALGAAGRNREADALLGAFVRVRTAEEAADLARYDPQWLAPRLLQAAGLLPGARHRDLLHALRVAGIVAN